MWSNHYYINITINVLFFKKKLLKATCFLYFFDECKKLITLGMWPKNLCACLLYCTAYVLNSALRLIKIIDNDVVR